MKTFLATIVIIVTAGIIITAGTLQKSSTTEVDLLQDVTDKQIAMPDPYEIIPLYHFENQTSGGIFSLTKVTDVSLNPKSEIKIEPTNLWLSNELERAKEISTFKEQVIDIIKKAGQDSSLRVNSSIYIPIATALNELSAKKVQKRILLVYSDLMENTKEMSFYRKENFSLLQTDPSKVKSYFEKLQKLNSLSGIEVHFIYQPDNNLSDEQYQILSTFYKNLLESHGAKVIISANLNF